MKIWGIPERVSSEGVAILREKLKRGLARKEEGLKNKLRGKSRSRSRRSKLKKTVATTQ